MLLGCFFLMIGDLMPGGLFEHVFFRCTLNFLCLMVSDFSCQFNSLGFSVIFVEQ